MARDEEGGDEGDSAYGWIYVVTLAALCVCALCRFGFCNDSHSQQNRHNFTYNNKLLLTKGSKRSLRLTQGTTT